MAGILLDTHIWSWTLTFESRLSTVASTALEEAETRVVSPVSFYEIAQKVRLGKWPAMAPYVGGLEQSVVDQGMIVAPLTAEIALLAGLLDWDHRDPFDRILAATALVMDIDLISADTTFDEVPYLRRMW